MEDRKNELIKQIETLKSIRELAGMNRTEFAQYMGIPRRTLEEWEGGRRKAPDYVLRLIVYRVRTEKILRENSLEFWEEK